MLSENGHVTQPGFQAIEGEMTPVDWVKMQEVLLLQQNKTIV